MTHLKTEHIINAINVEWMESKFSKKKVIIFFLYVKDRVKLAIYLFVFFIGLWHGLILMIKQVVFSMWIMLGKILENSEICIYIQVQLSRSLTYLAQLNLATNDHVNECLEELKDNIIHMENKEGKGLSENTMFYLDV
ncbi:hypothetical protein ACJX0J_016697 [Zea mays]